MKKAAVSAARLSLQVLLFVTLLAASSAEYRPRPPGPHMRGSPSHQPSPHKGYSSPSKPHHQHHHFHQNSYSAPSFNKGSGPHNRPMRYRKPGTTAPPQISRPTSWESSSYKSPSKDRYKQHYSSGEPPAGVNVASSQSFSPAAPVASYGGFESYSSGMDFKHLTDLSPIRTIPAPNLGPTSWPPPAHLGMGSLASQLAAQSTGGYSPRLQHHGLDISDASTASLLAASKQHAHGYQVTEAPHLFSAEADSSRTSPLIRPVVDSNLQNEFSLRLSPYASMSQFVGQPGYSGLSALSASPTAMPSVPMSSLSSQDLYQLLNGYPLQHDAHNYVRQGQSADTSQLQAQFQQAQLQQAQLQQAQLQQAQLQQLVALNSGADTRTSVPLRFSFDDQQQQQLLGLPGRRGQQHELEGADSSQVLRLYHNVPVNIGSHTIHRQPASHEDSYDSSDSEVDGSEHSAVAHSLSVSPSPSSLAEESQEYEESSAIGDTAGSAEAHFADSSSPDMGSEEEQEDTRPMRIRTRKNRDRGTS